MTSLWLISWEDFIQKLALPRQATNFFPIHAKIFWFPKQSWNTNVGSLKLQRSTWYHTASESVSVKGSWNWARQCLTANIMQLKKLNLWGAETKGCVILCSRGCQKNIFERKVFLKSSLCDNFSESLFENFRHLSYLAVSLFSIFRFYF